MPKVPSWIRRAGSFLVAAVVGNYIGFSFAAGIGIVGVLVVGSVSGLSGVSAVVLFVGAMLVLMSVAGMAANRYVPDAWLERSPSTPASLAPPTSETSEPGSAREDRARLKNLRSALLQVESELRVSRRHIEGALNAGCFWPFDTEFPHTVWLNNKVLVS